MHEDGNDDVVGVLVDLHEDFDDGVDDDVLGVIVSARGFDDDVDDNADDDD